MHETLDAESTLRQLRAPWGPVALVLRDAANDIRHVDEPELLARLRTGDEDAFAALFREHYPMLVVSATRLLGERAYAEEIAQDVMLTGEARFDVVHDTSRPFTVHTATATFRDVGTVFSIHSDQAEGARVVVLEGAVAVEGAGNQQPVTLAKGDRASIAPDGGVQVQRSALAADDTAWAEGRLVFHDAPVPQVVADLRRWYGIDVHVDSSLAAHHVSATFDRGAGADVGRVIAAMLGGGFRQDGSVLYIVPAPTAPAPR